MDKETYLRQKTDEMLRWMPMWGERCQLTPMTGMLELKDFLETVYDAGAATKSVMLTGRDPNIIIDLNNKENQQ